MTVSSGSPQKWFSFYCRSGYGESLLDHVRGMLGYDPGARIVRIGMSETDDFELGLKLAIAFHDAGKIPFSEERQFGGFYKGDTLTFTGHEFLSYIILDKAFHLPLSGLGNLTLKAVKLSVLLHHHPQNIKARFISLRSKAKSFSKITCRAFVLKKSSVMAFVDDLNDLKAFEPSLLAQIRSNLQKSLEDVIDISHIINQYESEITNYSRNPFKKEEELNRGMRIFMPMLLALITMDYVSAANRQPCSGSSTTNTTKFSEVARDFYRFYL
ncbi:MAG: HD domain-containing protein [Nitrososphaeria archaeon]